MKKKIRKPSVRIAKENRKHGEIDEAIKEFSDSIDEIDSSYLPPSSMLAKDSEQYQNLYHKGVYRDQIRRRCKLVMDFIGAEKKSSLSHANNLISTFRKTLETKNAPNQLLNYQLDEIANIFPEYAAKILPLKELTRIQIGREVSDMKKSQIPDALAEKLYELPIEHMAYGFLRMTKRQKMAYNRMIKNTSTERHQNPIVVDGNKIIYLSIELVKNRKTAPVRGLVCAVCCLTGRREIEILRASKFDKTKRRNHISFAERAKSSDSSAVDIPIIGVSPAEILDAIRIIREQKDLSALSNKEVNGRESRYLNEFVRLHYAEENLNVKYLRYLYKRYSEKFFYEKYGAPKKMTPEVYLASILAHDTNDLKSQLNYGALVATWKPFTKTQQKKIEIQRDQILSKKIDERRKKNKVKLIERNKDLKPLNEKACQLLLSKIQPLRSTFVEQKSGISAVSHAKAFDYLVDNLKKGELPTKSDIEANGSNRAIVKTLLEYVSKALPADLKTWPKKIHQVYPLIETAHP